MTRQEVIEQAALNFGINNPNGHWNADAEYEEDYETPAYNFQAGAEWADEHPKQITLSAADRGIIHEIIFALNSLGKEKMISYHKEIEFLNKIRNL